MKNLLLDVPPHLLALILSFDEVSHKSRELWLCGSKFLQAKIRQSVRLVALRDRRELVLTRLPRYLSFLPSLTHLEVDRSCFDISKQQDAREIVLSLNPMLEKLVFRVQNWQAILFPNAPSSDTQTPSVEANMESPSPITRFQCLKSLSVASKPQRSDPTSSWLTSLPSSLTELSAMIHSFEYISYEYLENLPRGLLKWEVEMAGKWSHRFNLLLPSHLPPQLSHIRFLQSRYTMEGFSLATRLNRKDGVASIPPSITRLETAYFKPIDESISRGQEVEHFLLTESHERSVSEVPFSLMTRKSHHKVNDEDNAELHSFQDFAVALSPTNNSSLPINDIIADYTQRPTMFTSLMTHQESWAMRAIPQATCFVDRLGKELLSALILPLSSLTLLQSSIDWHSIDSTECWPPSLRHLTCTSSKREAGINDEDADEEDDNNGFGLFGNALDTTSMSPSSSLQSSSPRFFFPPHLVSLKLDVNQRLPLSLINHLPPSLRSFKAAKEANINPLFCFYEPLSSVLSSKGTPHSSPPSSAQPSLNDQTISFPPYLTHLEFDHLILWDGADDDAKEGESHENVDSNEDDFFFLGAAPNDAFFAPKLIKVNRCFPFERLPATLRTLRLKGSSIPFSCIHLLPPYLRSLQVSFFKDADWDPLNPILNEKIQYMRDAARKDGLNIRDHANCQQDINDQDNNNQDNNDQANNNHQLHHDLKVESLPSKSSLPTAPSTNARILKLLPRTLTDLHIEMSDDLDGWDVLPPLKMLHIVSYEPLDGSVLLQLPMHHMTHLHVEKITNVTDEHVKALGRGLRYLHMNVDQWLTTPDSWPHWPHLAISVLRCPPGAKDMIVSREAKMRQAIRKEIDGTEKKKIFVPREP